MKIEKDELKVDAAIRVNAEAHAIMPLAVQLEDGSFVQGDYDLVALGMRLRFLASLKQVPTFELRDDRAELLKNSKGGL